MKLGLIAGNGRFPFLLLDAARAQGFAVTVAAIREETDPEINHRGAVDEKISVHWLSLGELSRLIETFHKEGVSMAVMAGQVKHKQIFSSIRPDWRLAKLLLNLRTRNTDMLLGAVAKVLGDEGIELISSTSFLEPLLAQEGVLTSRAPDEEERKNIEYGLNVARSVAGFDIGQTVVVAAQACVAVEAMEGTDAAIERAGALMRTPRRRRLHAHYPDDKDLSDTLQRRLTVVKVAKPKQDMRFDVPVIGIRTMETMFAAGASCLSVEAGTDAALRSRCAPRARQRGRHCHVAVPRMTELASLYCTILANSPVFSFHLFRRSYVKRSAFVLHSRGSCARGWIRHCPCSRSDDAQPPAGGAHLYPSLAGRLPDRPGQLPRQVGGALLLPQGHDPGMHHRSPQLPARPIEVSKPLNAVIVGVSVDTPDSHKQFCTKEGLTFRLLADPEHKVVDEYGSLGHFGAMTIAQRNTFLIDPEGKIVKVWTKVDPSHHSEEVLQQLAELKK